MRPTRRQFIQTGAALLACSASGCRSSRPNHPSPQIMSVEGPINPKDLGITLPHEHILVDFVGADKVSPDRYKPDDVYAVALPHLERVHDLGCQTLVDATPAYLGRDPRLLQRLSRSSGLTILTNTGYYGAANNKFLPAHAREETAAQLAQRWSNEWRKGIEDTGVRPGFIKIGVDRGPLSELHLKLVRAAALTHLETGLVIASHTGDGKAALEQLRVLKEEGVAARAFIWVHAQNESDPNVHLEAARQGAWIEFDGVRANRIEREVERLRKMREEECLDRVLVSHDAGWYHVGEPEGGTFRPFDVLFTELVPALVEDDWKPGQIDQLLQVNPREAFTIQVRPV